MTIRENVGPLLNRLLNNPFAALYAGMGILGTVWGAVVIYGQVWKSLPGAWAIPFHAALLLLLVCPAAGWWLTSYRRRYGLSIASDYFFPRVEKTWRIYADGCASFTTATTYYFLREPRAEELTDSAFGSAPLTLAQLNYQSPDSTPSDYKAINPHRHLIYWQPREEISAGEPYVHTVTAHYPYEGPLPVFKSLTVAPHARTLSLTVKVESELPIREAIAYRGYRFQRNRQAAEIALTARGIRHRRAPLPIRTSANRVEWTIDDVEAGATFYLVLFFEPTASVEATPAALMTAGA